MDFLSIQSKRVFLGIPVAVGDFNHLIAHLGLIDDLPQGRYVLPTNAHITIRFLANVPVDGLLPFWAAVQEVLSRFESFNCRVSEIALFPPKNAHLVAAMIENNHLLQRLFEQVNQLTAAFDLPVKNTVFKPHVTLYRYKLHGFSMQALPVTDYRLKARKVVLYESQLGVNGSIYKPLYTWDL